MSTYPPLWSKPAFTNREAKIWRERRGPEPSPRAGQAHDQQLAKPRPKVKRADA